MFIPGATGGGKALKADEAASKVSKAARIADKAGDFASVVIDQSTHQSYSKEWNAVLNYIRKANDTGGIKAAKSEILKYAERIYKDAPDLLKVTEEWLKSF